MTFSSPRLYLATGVTTMCTTGSVEFYANLKTLIDSGPCRVRTSMPPGLIWKGQISTISSRCTSSPVPRMRADW